MGVYIPNIEMPNSCGECQFICKESTCRYGKGYERSDFCPLVEVPKHGRLIDADALKADIQKHADIYANYGHHDLVSMAQRDALLCAVGDVVNAPTIVEADGKDADI